MPIKAAIYLKATTALIKTTSEHIQKTLGFMPDRRRKSPLYIFISTKNQYQDAEASPTVTAWTHNI